MISKVEHSKALDKRWVLGSCWGNYLLHMGNDESTEDEYDVGMRMINIFDETIKMMKVEIFLQYFQKEIKIEFKKNQIKIKQNSIFLLEIIRIFSKF